MTAKPGSPSGLFKSHLSLKSNSPSRPSDHLISLVTVPTSPKKKTSRNDMIYLSRSELENELQQFIRILTQQKTTAQISSSDHLSYIKKVISKLCVETPRNGANSSTQDTEKSGKGGDFSAACEQAELERRIYELEGEKRSYEKKLKTQVSHIAELEEQVSKLLKEHGNAQEKSENMVKGFDLGEGNKTPSTSTSSLMVADKIGSLIDNEVGLYDENTILRNELRQVRQKLVQCEGCIEEYAEKSLKQREKINGLEQDLEQFEEEVMTLAQSLKNRDSVIQEIQKKGRIQEEIIIQLQKENARLNDGLKSKDDEILELQRQYAMRGETIEQLQQENAGLNESLKLKDNTISEMQKQSVVREETIEHLKQENDILNDSLKHQDCVMQEMQNQSNIIREENLMLQQSMAEVEGSSMSQSTQLLLQIEQLADALKETEQNNKVLSRKCERLQKLIQSKTEMEALLKSRSEIVQGLEEKIESLVNEKSTSILKSQASLQESNLLSQRRETFGAISPKNSSPRSKGRISPSNELTFESSANKAVTKIYEEKIKILKDMNLKLEKDVEILKNELVNYREEVHWISKELQKYLDSYKKYDLEIEKKLQELAARNDPELLRLKNLYAYAKKDLLQSLAVVEDRQKL